MTQPEVSIVMPCKNAANFLSACIQSIRNQSYIHWELCVVDDHSTDTSRQILDDFAAQDPRIKVLSNEGVGIIHALRTGYRHTRGEYITRMDADDMMTVDKLDLMVTTLIEQGRGHIAVGLVEYFSEGQLGNGYIQYASWLNGLTRQSANFSDIYKECSIPSPCWMCHREDFVRSGAFDAEVYPEDYDLAFRLRAAGLSVVGIDAVLHRWRDYPHRTSRTHEHYSDNRFLALKVMHFLDQDYIHTKPLYLWGAGKKGKELAKLLIDRDVPFTWVCNNPRKIGKAVYGIVLQAVASILEEAACQILKAFYDEGNENELEVIDDSRYEVYRFC